jgi:hypothetical protein
MSLFFFTVMSLRTLRLCGKDCDGCDAFVPSWLRRAMQLPATAQKMPPPDDPAGV